MGHRFRPYEDGDSDGGAGAVDTVRCGIRTTTGGTLFSELPRSEVVGRRAGEVLRRVLEAAFSGSAGSTEDEQAAGMLLAADVRDLLMDPNCSVELRQDDGAARAVSDHTVLSDSQRFVFEVAKDHVGGSSGQRDGAVRGR